MHNKHGFHPGPAPQGEGRGAVGGGGGAAAVPIASWAFFTESAGTHIWRQKLMVT